MPTTMSGCGFARCLGQGLSCDGRAIVPMSDAVCQSTPRVRMLIRLMLVILACSLGQALIYTGEAVAVILGGNLASAFKINNISWRAAPLGLAVTAFLVAIAIAVLIREPKKGRFIVQVLQTFSCAPQACIWA